MKNAIGVWLVGVFWLRCLGNEKKAHIVMQVLVSWVFGKLEKGRNQRKSCAPKIRK